MEQGLRAPGAAKIVLQDFYGASLCPQSSERKQAPGVGYVILYHHAYMALDNNVFEIELS
jgi:hypothetical protein